MSEIQSTRQDGLAEGDDSGMSIGEMLSMLRAHLKLLGGHSCFRIGSRIEDLPAETGDIFSTSKKLNKTTFIRTIKHSIKILFQLDMGLVGMTSSVQ